MKNFGFHFLSKACVSEEVTGINPNGSIGGLETVPDKTHQKHCTEYAMY